MKAVFDKDGERVLTIRNIQIRRCVSIKMRHTA